MVEETSASSNCNHQFREDIRQEASAGFTYTITKLWCGLKYKYNNRGRCIYQEECKYKGNEKNCTDFVERY